MMLFLLVIWSAVAAVCAAVAKSKGRSPEAWFALGFLFSLVALFVLACLPSLAAPVRIQSYCIHCGAALSQVGNFCSWCGRQ
jgi:hypothetical protein